MDNRPIGVFDSGLGGLSVVRELVSLLPSENIVYFGDTGRVPYGTRSRETIEKYAGQDGRFLLSKDVKMVIAACGTVSSVAASVLDALPVPAIGVVDAPAAAACAATKNGKIGVIGTAATVRSGAFAQAIARQMPTAQVFAAACPLFVPLVENGWIEPDNEVTLATARRYLEPLKAQGVDTLILGCTHFPLLAPIIAQVMGGEVTLIDTGKETARAAAQMLRETDALSAPSATPDRRFFVSDRPDDFIGVAEMFLGSGICDEVATVNMDTEDAG